MRRQALACRVVSFLRVSVGPDTYRVKIKIDDGVYDCGKGTRANCSTSAFNARR